MPGAKENTFHPGGRVFSWQLRTDVVALLAIAPESVKVVFFPRDICIKRLYKTVEVSALPRYRYLFKSLALARRDTVARFARVFV